MSEGVKPSRRSFAADGSIVEEGLYLELEWGVLESAADYLTLLTAFGLHDALTNEITIYARDARFVNVRYNGIAVRPELGRDARWDMFPRGVTILVKNLEAAS